MSRFVYAIHSDAGFIKIGISNNPASRLARLQQQQPFSASLVHTEEVDTEHAHRIEAKAHKLLRSKHHRGEWFTVSAEEAVEAIQTATKTATHDEEKPSLYDEEKPSLYIDFSSIVIDPNPVPPYEYRALLQRMAWTHATAAETFGYTRRTSTTYAKDGVPPGPAALAIRAIITGGSPVTTGLASMVEHQLCL